MRNKNRRWLFVWIIGASLLHVCQCEFSEANNATRQENSTYVKEQRSVFSPRMDYEQWTPLGRGDPLKNDPTYDYVPPVLDRVHYWMDPALRKPDPPLPGENQKTEILVLGVSSKKPSTPKNNLESRGDGYDPFMKFVDGPKFQNNYQRVARPHYHSPYSYYPYYSKSKISDRPISKVPYTMLMPPPAPTQIPFIEQSSTTPSTTQSSVTIQESNLIYQSSTLGDNDWSGNDETSFHTDSSSVVTWRTPLPYNDYNNNNQPKNRSAESFIMKQHFLNNSSHMENVNIKHDSFEMTLNSYNAQISGPDVMYKGEVSDGDMDVASTYVNIGKPEAQVHTISGPAGVAVVPQVAPPDIMTAAALETMLPPPALAATKPSPLAALLKKEITPSLLSTMTSLMANIPRVTTEVYTTTTTTTPAPSTTTINSLTTDPLFKHYKQPSEPLRGPMYLIIQGHSKVKTYGPSKQIHGINIQEINEIPTSDYKDEYQVKHLHTYRRKPEEFARIGRAKNFDNLFDVVRTGLGAIDYAKRRHDVQETELVASFDVGPQNNATEQVYRKGYVDEGEPIEQKPEDA